MADGVRKLIREVFDKRDERVPGAGGSTMPVVVMQIGIHVGAKRKRHIRWTERMDADRWCLMLSKLMAFAIIKVGKVVLWQKKGILVDANRAPFLADLYPILFAHEPKHS